MKRIIIIYAMAVIVMPIATIGAIYAFVKPPQKVEKKANDNAIVIIPMNQDNEGRQLFILKTKDSTYEYMYAEEIGMSLLKDSVVTDEMIHFCDHFECQESQ
jgi:hypothetical protein